MTPSEGNLQSTKSESVVSVSHSVKAISLICVVYPVHMCFLMFDKKRKKSVYLTAFLHDYDTTLSFSVLLAPNHL